MLDLPIGSWRIATALVISAPMFWLCGTSPPSAHAAIAHQPKEIISTVERYAVQFSSEISSEDRLNLVHASGGKVIAQIDALNLALVEFNHAPDRMRGMMGTHTLHSSTEGVKFFEPETEVAGTLFPDDPDLKLEDRSYNLRITNTVDGWDLERGSPQVVIAVVDTGIGMEHPEFHNRLLEGYDFVNNDVDPNDDHGHGTHVAGIIGAAIDNGYGSGGICPGCSILPVKVLDDQNTGTWFAAAQGIVYAVDRGAHVINLSLGSASPSKTIETALEYAESMDVMVVAAAGNAGSERPFYPAAYKSVLSIGATDQRDQLWSSSNFGDSIDVTAPGHFIYSAAPELNNEYGGFTFKSGTSMASPHVAGLAGLLLSQDQSRNVDEIGQLILTTADDLGVKGWDPQFGHGRINIAAALSHGLSSTRDATLSGNTGISDLNQPSRSKDSSFLQPSLYTYLPLAMN